MWKLIDQLLLLYTFYGSGLAGIHLFIFASCEPLTLKWSRWGCSIGSNKHFSHISLLSRQFFDWYFLVIVTLMDRFLLTKKKSTRPFLANYRISIFDVGKNCLHLKSHRSKNSDFYFSIKYKCIHNLLSWAKFHLKKSFGRVVSNFRQNGNVAKWKSVIWPPFWNGKSFFFLNFFFIFLTFFCLIVVLFGV